MAKKGLKKNGSKTKISLAWDEIDQLEDEDLFIMKLCEEMFNTTMQRVKEKYLETQSVYFSVHCSHIAWKQVLELYFFRIDPGENPNMHSDYDIPDKESSWIPDIKPTASPRDSWAAGQMPIQQSIYHNPGTHDDTDTINDNINLETS